MHTSFIALQRIDAGHTARAAFMKQQRQIAPENDRKEGNT